MGDFVCDICNITCNTAFGHYWAKDLITLSPETKGKALCWLCIPEVGKVTHITPRQEIIDLYLERQRKKGWIDGSTCKSST